MTEYGGVIEGEAPPNRGDVREGVPAQRGAHYNPHNIQSLQKTQRHRRVWGHVHPLGHTNVWGHMNVWVYKHGGHPDTPQV